MDITLLRSFSTTRRIKTGTWSQYQPVFELSKSPCMDACPCSTDIPKIFDLFLKGKDREAAQELSMSNPLAPITGRICPAFCEASCNRREFDQPVGIREIERFLGDLFLEEKLFPEKRGYLKGRVAVVGSGPAGLTASWFMALHGFEVHVYEELDHPGGVLYWGVPDFRLDKRVLKRCIERWEEFGVVFHTGRKVTPDELQEISDCDFVIIASGLTKPKRLSIPGIEHTISGVDFLKDYNLGRFSKFPDRAVVIGGGNVAVDAARVLAKSGAKVVLCCVEDRENMPAIPEEVQEALEDGVVLKPSTGVVAIEPSSSGLTLKLSKVRVVDERDRVKEVEFVGEPWETEASLVVAALGQEKEFEWEGLVCGDLKEGPSTVAQAVASAKDLVCELLHINLQGDLDRKDKVVSFNDLNLFYFEKRSRFSVRDVASACEEASRCFSCGYCNLCANCWIFCPDVSVVINWDEAPPSVDVDHCKGCGICAVECPRAVISMRRKY